MTSLNIYTEELQVDRGLPAWPPARLDRPAQPRAGAETQGAVGVHAVMRCLLRRHVHPGALFN